MSIDHNFFKDRQKKYLHFDYPISSEKIYHYVTNQDNINKHAFYPFIHFELISRKIKKKGFKVINGARKIIVEKQEPKIRPIKYSAHIDGHIYAYYAFLLSPFYEEILIQKQIQDCVLAFRKLPNSPNNINFAKKVFDEVKERQNCSVICLDIKSFFDELDHELLKQAWKEVLGIDALPNDHYNVFKSITKYSYVEKNLVYQNLKLSLNRHHKDLKRLCTSEEFREKIRSNKIICKNNLQKGIPQGSALSAFLSNIYMMKFDEKLKKEADKFDAKYYRYCDDILIICDRANQYQLLRYSQTQITKMKLTIQDKKTKIAEFKNGIRVSKDELQYLGFTYDGIKILLRDTGLAKYSYKANKAIRMTNKRILKINLSRINRGLAPLIPHKKYIYRRFSFIGQRNYISYALRAAKIMNEPAIKKQIQPHWLNLKRKLLKYDDLNQDFYDALVKKEN
ncbi:hypothetical protein GFH30_01130 [Acinetobacter wanghuae]|uniref:Reverse transcriptase domain-containing protein n=1 Tax=Acinetobacter wanghuae TaxID=2662362 RepID=A0A5Q0NZY7_9GAMM|nr:antiviral reverse transcriptase Drt2 [Acinetobacter wanghuae]MQW91987.1 hypothetical protein [Acinetobacter wanghuae]QGA10084.1 hypothetical protein GFH30_01130 [Acinetobacter wanghuae]